MNMLDRTMHYMERDPSRSYTLTELRKAAGIAMRSQYRLAQQLLDSGMVVRVFEGGVSGFRISDYLRQELADREQRIVAAYVSEGLGE